MKLMRPVVATCATIAIVSALLAGCGSTATSDEAVLTPAPKITPTAAGEAATESDQGTDEGGSTGSRETRTSSPTKSASPSKSHTKDPDGPMFVTSLPDTVTVGPFQTIIVQIPTDATTRWTANVNGTAKVTSVEYSNPPGDQPGAPGISIATVTAPNAGTAYINFVQTAKGGGPTLETARLEVIVK